MFEHWHTGEFIWFIPAAIIAFGVIATFAFLGVSPSSRKAHNYDHEDYIAGAIIGVVILIGLGVLYGVGGYTSSTTYENQILKARLASRRLVVTGSDIHGNTVDFISGSRACKANYVWLTDGNLKLYGANCTEPLILPGEKAGG